MSDMQKCPCCKIGGTDDSRDCNGSLASMFPRYDGLKPACIPLGREFEKKGIRLRKDLSLFKNNQRKNNGNAQRKKREEV